MKRIITIFLLCLSGFLYGQESRTFRSTNGTNYNCYTASGVNSRLTSVQGTINSSVDTKVSAATNSSKLYTDNKVAIIDTKIATLKSEIIVEASGYIDAKVSTLKSEVIAESNGYIDSKIATLKSEAVSESNTYTDTKIATLKSEVLAEANAYTDSKIVEVDQDELKAYVEELVTTLFAEQTANIQKLIDTAVAKSLVESKSFTNTQITGSLNTLPSFTGGRGAVVEKTDDPLVFKITPQVYFDKVTGTYKLNYQ